MKTLFIDTHLYDIDIILFDNDTIYKEEHIKNKKYNSIYLMPSIEKVISNEDFDEIVVVIGPGSFTGVRLGVTVAKTLAYTMNKIIKPVTYFDLLNFSSDNANHIFALSDGNGYFVAEYNNNVLKKDLKYLNNNQFEEYRKNKNIETDVSIDYKKVIMNIKEVKEVNPHLVNPIYIKKIGVEQ